MALDSIEDAIREIADGRMIVAVDDENRENEGDLLMAADRVTPEAISFMARFGRGLICAPFEAGRLAELGLGPMVPKNGDPHGTAFTVSVDHVKSTTGISAHERAATIRALADPAAKPEDFHAPGHVFPLASRAGGVLKRRGHTEAAVNLARLAGSSIPGGVICEIMKDDGTMARLPDLRVFAEEHGLKLISIDALAAFLSERQQVGSPTMSAAEQSAPEGLSKTPGSDAPKLAVTREAETRLPTRYGEFRMIGYRETKTGKEHVALAMGDIADGKSVLVRVHSECLTGDALGSRRCDCGEQYDAAMRAIAEEGRGLLVYLRQEGRGIGLVNKIRAYALQDRGFDTVDANLHLGFRADERDYSVGIGILKDLGVSKLRLMTNNPAKLEGLVKNGLQASGLEITERVPVVIQANAENERYLRTKEERMNHQFGGKHNEAV